MKKIHYQLCNRVNIGTEEAPVWHESFVEKIIPHSEANMEIAKKEAYGKPTIEDDGQPDPEVKPTDAERIAELEEALDMLLNGVTE